MNIRIATGLGSLMLSLKAYAYYHYDNIKDCSISYSYHYQIYTYDIYFAIMCNKFEISNVRKL